MVQEIDAEVLVLSEILSVTSSKTSALPIASPVIIRFVSSVGSASSTANCIEALVITAPWGMVIF